MRLDVVTIFPEYLDPLRHALLGRAIERGILEVGVHNLRDWAHDVHKSADGVLDSALPHVPATVPEQVSAQDRGEDAAAASDGDRRPVLVVPTPGGAPFTQDTAQRWSGEDRLVFACGRYEGIDQRVFDDAAQRYRVEEVSLGDYVLIGGEVAVLVMAEAVVRLIPGVLGNRRSHEEDSFQDGLLEGPAYTKPRVWRDLEVPGVLTSGDHGKVDRWRRDQALLRTARQRPDLIEAARARGDLDRQDLGVLGE